jgi:hypothetical protein
MDDLEKHWDLKPRRKIILSVKDKKLSGFFNKNQDRKSQNGKNYSK